MNSYGIFNKLRNCKTTEKNDMVSFNVKFLFPDVPVADTLNCLKILLEEFNYSYYKINKFLHFISIFYHKIHTFS